MTMPKQKPGRSKQDYRTPLELLQAVRERLHIADFSWDLAADAQNAVTQNFYSEIDNSLRLDLTWNPKPGQWAWCNPPYSDITPWVAKACDQSANDGAHIAMLVPASVGANWWRDLVDGYAYVLFLNGRVTFQGCTTPYPKDCAILLYSPMGATGYEVWKW